MEMAREWGTTLKVWRSLLNPWRHLVISKHQEDMAPNGKRHLLYLPVCSAPPPLLIVLRPRFQCWVSPVLCPSCSPGGHHSLATSPTGHQGTHPMLRGKWQLTRPHWFTRWGSARDVSAQVLPLTLSSGVHETLLGVHNMLDSIRLCRESTREVPTLPGTRVDVGPSKTWKHFSLLILLSWLLPFWAP